MSTTASAPGSDADGLPDAQQQTGYNFSGRVLLTAVTFLVVLTVVFVLLRLVMYHVVASQGGFPGRGLTGNIFHSFRRSSRRGLDASVLAALPVIAYRKGGAGTEATDCAVCLAELADGEKVRELPNCGHLFHLECVDAWLRARTTCPVCRAEAEPVEKVDAGQPSALGPPLLFGAGGALVAETNGSGGSTSAAGRPGPSESFQIMVDRSFVVRREGGSDLERQ